MSLLRSKIWTVVNQKPISLLRCKVVFDQDFLRWPNQTFYTSDRYVNNFTLQIQLKSIKTRDLYIFETNCHFNSDDKIMF